jgi:hypothetical protein
METSPYYPFPPRPGVGLEGVNFNAEPGLLTDAELQETLDFEHDLYGASLDAATFPRAAAYQQKQKALGVPLQPLETVWKQKVNSSRFGVGYFMTDEGGVALHEVFGVQVDVDTPEEMATALASLDTRTINSKVLDKLVADSVGYEEERLTEAFKASGFLGRDLQAPHLVHVYKNPETLVAKARGYRQLKAYITQAKADLQAQAVDDDSAVSAAQLVLVDKYRQRINGFLAGTYVEAYKLLAQHRASGEAIHGSEISDLESVVPVFSSQSDDARVAGFLQRMDRYRHGVSRDEQGHFTWLSPLARNLADNADHIQTAEADRGIYEDIDPEVLESTMIDGNTFRDSLLAPVLQEYGLLSSVEEWDSERIGPATDGNWQVIVNDKFKSLAVNDKQRVVKVPAKLTSLMTAVSVGNHELTHVLQHGNKRALGQLAILEKIGLDNASEQTEAGGMWQQRVAHNALSGVARDTVAGTGYYKNLEIKARGGSYGECVQAYYEDLRQRDPNMTADKAAAQAVNRARRVFRSGGFEFAQNTHDLTNTQPLNYLEQRLIYEGLDHEARKFLLIGGVTIASLVELRQYGLVDTNKIIIPDEMPWQLMHPAVKELLAL